MLFIKRKLYKEIRTYIDAKKQRSLFHFIDTELLYFFYKTCRKKTIAEVEPDDLKTYCEKMRSRVNGTFFYISAIKEIKSMLRFYNLPVHKCITTEGNVDFDKKISTIHSMNKFAKGRPLKIKDIERVKELKSKGLSFREIAAIMKRDVSLIHRWYNRPLTKGKLSTD